MTVEYLLLIYFFYLIHGPGCLAASEGFGEKVFSQKASNSLDSQAVLALYFLLKYEQEGIRSIK